MSKTFWISSVSSNALPGDFSQEVSFSACRGVEEGDFFQAKIMVPMKPIVENSIIIPWKKNLVGILSMGFFHSTQDLCINRLLKVNFTSVFAFP